MGSSFFPLDPCHVSSSSDDDESDDEDPRRPRPRPLFVTLDAFSPPPPSRSSRSRSVSSALARLSADDRTSSTTRSTRCVRRSRVFWLSSRAATRRATPPVVPPVAPSPPSLKNRSTSPSRSRTRRLRSSTPGDSPFIPAVGVPGLDPALATLPRMSFRCAPTAVCSEERPCWSRSTSGRMECDSITAPLASLAAVTATLVTSATRRLVTASSSSNRAIRSLSVVTSAALEDVRPIGDPIDSPPPFMSLASWSRRMSANPSMALRTDGVTLYQSLSPTTRSRMLMNASTEGGRVLPSSRPNDDIYAKRAKMSNDRIGRWRSRGALEATSCERRWTEVALSRRKR